MPRARSYARTDARPRSTPVDDFARRISDGVAGGVDASVDQVRSLRRRPVALALACVLGAAVLVALVAAAIHAVGGVDALAATGVVLVAVAAGVRFLLGLALVGYAGVELVRRRERIGAPADLVDVALAGALGLGLLGGVAGLIACVALGLFAALLATRGRRTAESGPRTRGDAPAAGAGPAQVDERDAPSIG